MSGRVVSDIQTRAEGESLYIRYNTDANNTSSASTSNNTSSTSNNTSSASVMLVV